MSGWVLAREKRHLWVRRASISLSQAGAGDVNRSHTNLRISAAGAVRQLKEEELDRSKIPEKERWLIPWIEALSEPSSDLLK